MRCHIPQNSLVKNLGRWMPVCIHTRSKRRRMGGLCTTQTAAWVADLGGGLEVGQQGYRLRGRGHRMDGGRPREARQVARGRIAGKLRERATADEVRITHTAVSVVQRVVAIVGAERRAVVDGVRQRRWKHDKLWVLRGLGRVLEAAAIGHERTQCRRRRKPVHHHSEAAASAPQQAGNAAAPAR